MASDPAMQYRFGYVVLRQKLNRLAATPEGGAADVELHDRERAELLQELESALANVDAAMRILARWDSFDAVVQHAEKFLRQTAEGAEHADRIDRCRMSIGGQP